MKLAAEVLKSVQKVKIKKMALFPHVLKKFSAVRTSTQRHSSHHTVPLRLIDLWRLSLILRCRGGSSSVVVVAFTVFNEQFVSVLVLRAATATT